MNYPLAARVGLGYLALNAAVLGLWAVLAPRSFYDNFPGAGRAWVAIDGPYNEHLIRDVGALNLALLVLLGFGAVYLTRQLVTIAAIASLAWAVPHLLYHLFNTDGLSNGDIVASIGGLVLGAAFPALLLWVAPRLEARAG